MIGVAGDGEPGRHHWFFTPAPLYLASGTEDEEEWLDLGIVAPVEELTFVEAGYAPREGGFHLRLEYDGHTEVDGEFEAPTLVLTPGRARSKHGPTAPPRGPRRARRSAGNRRPRPPGLVDRADLLRLGSAVLPRDDVRRLADGAGDAGKLRPLHRRRSSARGSSPGTVVLDDKWQAAYGTNEPDTAKWPDLKAWIARATRGAARPALVEGLGPGRSAAELCIRNAGRRAGRRSTRRTRRRASAGASAHACSGRTASTPTGSRSTSPRARRAAARSRTERRRWGIALLHQLLAVVYRAAKEAKPDALVITHTPHPAFVDVADMIRLNDMIGGIVVVPQMTFRAEVARAALSGPPDRHRRLADPESRGVA